MEMFSIRKLSVDNELKKVHYTCHKTPLHFWMCSKKKA